MEKVLVTGGSGYIAQHCIAELLKKGYSVRTSLRSENREAEVRQAIAKEVDAKNNLEFCQLNLNEDEGWNDAMIGCSYVLHVASPFPFKEPKNENDVIIPAKEGTIRALKAAKKANIKKLILTSSVAAIQYGHDDPDKVFDHNDWTNIEGKNVTPYVKSKTIAEKAAWDFMESQTEKIFDMTVINPSFVLGPSLSDDIGGTSTDTIKRFLTREIPAVPNVYMNYVDVRDIAKLQVEAIKNTKSNGKRFACTSNESVPLIDIAKTLSANGFPKVTTKTLPDFVVKFLALFSAEMKTMKTFLNQKITMDNSQTVDVFSWTPIPFEKTIIDMGKSIQDVMDNR